MPTPHYIHKDKKDATILAVDNSFGTVFYTRYRNKLEMQLAGDSKVVALFKVKGSVEPTIVDDDDEPTKVIGRIYIPETNYYSDYARTESDF